MWIFNAGFLIGSKPNRREKGSWSDGFEKARYSHLTQLNTTSHHSALEVSRTGRYQMAVLMSLAQNYLIRQKGLSGEMSY